MTAPTPYSHARGVLNTRVKASEQDATLADLRARFVEPVELEISAVHYHNATPRERGDVKKSLPYFVGGVIEGKRHDDNVVARTLLTLDIERSKKQTSEPPQPQDVFQRLKNLGAEGWVYTSLSHTPGSPRYRVVLPLGETISGGGSPDTLVSTTRAAAAKLGIEEWCTPESWVLSQPMYLPAKLRGGVFWEGYAAGKQWKPRVGPVEAPKTKTATGKALADIPDDKLDPVLHALREAGLYLGEDPKHKGKHYITCPQAHDHGSENETQTVYYEAHHDGNPRPAVKCFDTDPDHDGHPHLTFKSLVHHLREHGYLTKEKDTTGVLEDYEAFRQRADISTLLNSNPPQREFAWEQFAPVGKVTVLAGPGGVSKSMMMLHLLVYGALGQDWAGFRCGGPVRGLYASYEDDTAELHKRVHSLAQALRDSDDGMGDLLYDVEGQLRSNLLLYAAEDEALSWLLMSKSDQRSAPERTERVEWLIGFLQEYRMNVLVLDPAVYVHNLEESAPGDMALLMQTLNYIAKAAHVAVIILHHMHKTAQWATLDEVNQGSLRGASSLADNARSVGVMVSMPPKDAPRYGLAPDHDTTSRFAVFKHVKHNYSASMGSLLFERRGPLLLPRPDLTRMDDGAAAEASAERKARDKDRAVQSKANTILGWVLGHENAPASVNMLREGTGIRYQLFKEALKWCVDMGYLDTEDGPNRGVWHTVSVDGKVWLKTRAAEEKKGLK